jgi:hypothetical protein
VDLGCDCPGFLARESLRNEQGILAGPAALVDPGRPDLER